MPETLDEFERRVLSVLMEKALTQPEYYPMTANALVSGCNQKSNRDPVLELDEDAVLRALERLRERNLVTVVLPAPGARTKRFKHEADAHFGWQPRERAVMTELLLRGPQTIGELRTHCSRMMPFENVEAVTVVLDCLARAETPWVAPLPRQPGQAATRYTHLLYPEGEQPVTTTLAEPVATRPAGGSADLRSELERLAGLVTDLQNRVEQLESQLSAPAPPPEAPESL